MTDNQPIIYFAYGSNLDVERMEERTGPVSILGTALLNSYLLKFHKKGVDGTGKANVCYTGVESDHVYGALYSITQEGKESLDRIEIGYDLIEVEVTDSNKKKVRAVTYVTKPGYIDESLIPKMSYRECVVRGALHFKFPDFYIDSIKAIPTV
jgi:gamma-glutamylcyclotransferase